MLKNRRHQTNFKSPSLKWSGTINISAVLLISISGIYLLLFLVLSANEAFAGLEPALNTAPSEGRQASRTISGQIFVDYNRDGSPNGVDGKFDPAEVSGRFPSRILGQDDHVTYSDFVVQATDADGKSASGIIQNDGRYVISTAELGGDDFIVELTLPGNYSEALNRPTFEQTNPRVSHLADVPEIGIANHHIGVMPPSYCPHLADGSGAWVFTTCFVKGDIEDEEGPQDVWVGAPYNDPTMAQMEHYFTKAEIGSIWGVAYDEWTGIAYSSAFLKRHTELGPQGLDGLYWFKHEGGHTTVSDTALYSVSLGDTEDVGGSPSSYSAHFPLGDEPTRDVNVLPYTDQTYDQDVYAYIAKTGIGGIDLTADGKTLAVTNIDAKSIILYDTSNASEGTIQFNGELGLQDEDVACPNANPTNNHFNPSDWYPFAITFLDTETLYVGVICTAEGSQSTKDLNLRILEIAVDGQTRAPISVSDIAYELPLDYDKACPLYTKCNEELDITGGFQGVESGTGIQQKAGRGNGNFQYWDNIFDFDQITFAESGDADRDPRVVGMVFHPQPILSDISVELDGSLTLNVSDRFGHQAGFDDPPPIPDDPRLFRSASGGEMIKVCNIGGNASEREYQTEGESGCDPNPFELETNAGKPQEERLPQALLDALNIANNVEFPNEYGFRGGPITPAGEFYPNEKLTFHPETSMGSAWIPPRRFEIVTTQTNPERAYSGGLTWYSTEVGATLDDLELYYSEPNTSAGTFSKANGLGDIDGCALPVEIGDRVWLDLNGNGAQDADEKGLRYATVSLLIGNQLIATAHTDEYGYYYFDTIDELATNISYTLRFDISKVNNISEALRSDLERTDRDVEGVNDELDSDADSDTIGPFIEVPRFQAGFVGHSYDVGFRPSTPQQSFEMGDLPDHYQTLLESGGPYHVWSEDFGFGDEIDTEEDGHPSVNARGDDNDNSDDEDGVSFSFNSKHLVSEEGLDGTTSIFPESGKPVTVTVSIETRLESTTEQTATVGAWLDLNGDGKFENSESYTEFQTFSVSQTTGENQLHFYLPEATTRAIYSRFRIAYDPSEVNAIDKSGGLSLSGEVEDYIYQLETRSQPIEFYELGDLPNEYKTLLEDNGPHHLVVPSLGIGKLTDYETNGHPSTDTKGDDFDNTPDDEDGVEFHLIYHDSVVLDPGNGMPTRVPEAGKPVTVVVTITSKISESVGTTATVGAWLDLNNDGEFENTNSLTEFQTFEITQAQPGTEYVQNTLTFQIPKAKNQTIYSRFRIAYDQSEVGTIDRSIGEASSGEVEDHIYKIVVADEAPVELGDLPDLYKTYIDSDGPYHNIVPELRLGRYIDSDSDGAPTKSALGDDQVDKTDDNPVNDVDDEDGVEFGLIYEKFSFKDPISGLTYTLPAPLEGEPITVVVTVTSRISTGMGTQATVGAWLDLDEDGEFNNTSELTEFQTYQIEQSDEPGSIVKTTLVFPIPNGIPKNITRTIYSRFRIAYDPNEVGTIDRWYGPASSGEVEDYIYTRIPTAIELKSFTGERSGNKAVTLKWETDSEINNFGFKLLRNSELDFSSAEEIGFIPSAIGSGPGTVYQWLDDQIPQHGIYHYWLIDIDLDGTETTHGPVTVGVTDFNHIYLPMMQD